MSDAILDLHPLLSERVRLAIMALLAASKDPLGFTQLEEALEVTRGNLSSHLKKLEDGKLVKVQKQFVDRKPLSTYECTLSGRKEIDRYLETMERTLKKLKAEK